MSADRNWPAEIECSPDGRHLYVSNRGHDSIAVFDVDPKGGRLTAKGHVPAGGKNPRHFAIDASGTWMFVAHQNDAFDSGVPLGCGEWDAVAGRT